MSSVGVARHFVEFFTEQRQVRAAARVFFVEPSHQMTLGIVVTCRPQSLHCCRERSILLCSRIGFTSCQDSATMMESLARGAVSRISRVCIIAYLCDGQVAGAAAEVYRIGENRGAARSSGFIGRFH